MLRFSRDVHLSKFANHGHHLRRGNDSVEVDVSGLNLKQQILTTNHLSTSINCTLGISSTREHAHSDLLASSKRKGGNALDRLIGLTRVQTCVN